MTERETLIADICGLLDRGRRAHDRAMNPPSSWSSTIHAFANLPGTPQQAFAFVMELRGLASPVWRPEARDYVNYLWSASAELRFSTLTGLKTGRLWEILLLLAES